MSPAVQHARDPVELSTNGSFPVTCDLSMARDADTYPEGDATVICLERPAAPHSRYRGVRRLLRNLAHLRSLCLAAMPVKSKYGPRRVGSRTCRAHVASRRHVVFVRRRLDAKARRQP